MSMILSDISELMAVAIGMNFAFIITTFIPKTSLSYFLNTYFENSEKKVVRRELQSMLIFQNIIGKIDYLSNNNGNSGKFDVLTIAIIEKENKSKLLIEKFQVKAKSCLNLVYLPQISLLLGLYSLIIMWLAPFHASNKHVVECGLLTFNILTIIAIVATIILQQVQKPKIGYKHYFIYFIASVVFLLLSLSNSEHSIFYNLFFYNILQFSLYSVIIMPFLVVIYFLLKAFLVNEFQIAMFNLRLRKLNHKQLHDTLNQMISDFEGQNSARFSEKIVITVGK